MNDRPPRKPRVALYDDPLPVGSAPLARKPPGSALSIIELEFCRILASTGGDPVHRTDYNPTRAAIAAGYNPRRANFTARRLMADPRIRRQLAIIEGEAARKINFDVQKFLANTIRLAEASVADELLDVWVPPCRYCWGRNNEYQRTHAEFSEAFEAWVRMPDRRRRGQPSLADFGYGEVLVYDDGGMKVPFDQKGGDGYNVEEPPNPDCPNCFGRGLETEAGTVPYVKWKDWRDLSDTGKLLLAGAEQTPKGAKLLLRNQDDARKQLMGLLGRWLEFQSVQRNVGIPASAAGFAADLSQSISGYITDDPRSLTDHELDQLLAGYGVVIDESDITADDAG